MIVLPWNPVLVPSSENWNPNAGASRSGGGGQDNDEQVVRGPAGYVTASLTVPCNTRAKVLAMRALLAGLDGRANAVLVGPIEVTRAPWHVDPLTGAKITTGRGNRDAALDPAWDANPDTSADLDFKLAAPAALNATSLTLTRTRGGLLEPGMLFSVGNRLHVILALTTVDPTGPEGQAAPGNIGITFRPWLRAAQPTGTPVEFAKPVCAMRLATDDIGGLELQLSKTGVVSLDLVQVTSA